jgi:hypothetical protein
LTFINNTTGASYQEDIPYASSRSSVDWIEEMPLGVTGNSASYIPLDSFGTVQFKNATTIANGSSQSLATAGAQTLTMLSPGNGTLATPSVVGNDGSSFTVARSDVSAPFQAQVARSSVVHRDGQGISSFTPGTRPYRTYIWQNQTGSSSSTVSYRYTHNGSAVSIQYFFRTY